MTSVAQQMSASREARKRQTNVMTVRSFSPLTPVIQRMYSNRQEEVGVAWAWCMSCDSCKSHKGCIDTTCMCCIIRTKNINYWFVYCQQTGAKECGTAKNSTPLRVSDRLCPLLVTPRVVTHMSSAEYLWPVSTWNQPINRVDQQIKVTFK